MVALADSGIALVIGYRPPLSVAVVKPAPYLPHFSRPVSRAGELTNLGATLGARRPVAAYGLKGNRFDDGFYIEPDPLGFWLELFGLVVDLVEVILALIGWAGEDFMHTAVPWLDAHPDALDIKIGGNILCPHGTMFIAIQGINRKFAWR